MNKLFATAALAASLLLAGASVVRAADSQDFPPGMFTDNNRYSLDDLKGKVVVLFFFEETCPRCRGLIPERNKLIESLKDKPVKFIAVDPGHPLNDSLAYANQTHFHMPIFADPLRVMEARWKEHISLNNIYQFKVIGPEGKVIAYREEDIAAAADKASWKFKDKGYNAKLAAAIDAFEWGRYVAGMQLLRPNLKSSNKAVLEDAVKLYADIKAEGDQWKADADKAADEDPITAFDLYSKIAAVFDKDELGKSVAEPLKKLKTNKAVKDELAARQMYDQLAVAISKATSTQKGQIATFCASIGNKYPQTPTGKKALEFVKEITSLNGNAGNSGPATDFVASASSR